MPLRKTRLYFGYANLLPLGNVTSQNILDLEKELCGEFLIKGKNVPNDKHFELRCQHEDKVFTLKIQVAGEVQMALPEPLHAITVLIGNDGVPLKMDEIYNKCLAAINHVVELPNFVATKEATLRILYGRISDKPAYQYLWENILHQESEKLHPFCRENGRIAGTGVRLRISPKPITEDSKEIVQADLKIESFVKDTRYLFVESKFNWVTPCQYSSIDEFYNANEINVKYVNDNTEISVEEFIGEKII